MGGNRHSPSVLGSDHSGTIEFDSLSPAFGSLLGRNGLELTLCNGDNRRELHLVPYLTFQCFEYRCLSKAWPAPRNHIVSLQELLFVIRLKNFLAECVYAKDTAFVGPLPRV